MDEIEVAGLRIAFERAGEGPPLVLLHGILGDSRVWRRQLDDLSDEFTVVAWDAPGCGRSSDPLETFRMPQYADYLAGFVDALGLRAPPRARAFPGVSARARILPPASYGPDDAGTGLGLRGVGRLSGGRGGRTAPAAVPT